MKLWLVFLLFLLTLPYILAETISIGVQPSKVEIELSDSKPQVILPLMLWNEGSLDLNYSLEPKDDLKEFIKCKEGFWCGEKVFVPGNTSKQEAKVVNILFTKSDGDKVVDSGIYVKPELEGSGMLVIQPQVLVKVKVIQSTTTIPKPRKDRTTTTIFFILLIGLPLLLFLAIPRLLPLLRYLYP